MLTTPITRLFRISIPIIGAPMAGVSDANLVVAISKSGALGTLGIGSTATVDWASQQIDQIQKSNVPFGIGLMAWCLVERPELLSAAIEAKPTFISLSFGELHPHIDKVKNSGIRVAVQIGETNELDEALTAGADLIVIRGMEAGGHGKNCVTTLTLLQEVLGRTDIPILAGGGISNGRGLAAILAAGASGAWLGTSLIATTEALTSEPARDIIFGAGSSDTIYTRAFDIAQEIPWPKMYGGRTLCNDFTNSWSSKEDELEIDNNAKIAYARALKERNFQIAHIYAGQAVGGITDSYPAGEIITKMAREAEHHLRRSQNLIVS